MDRSGGKSKWLGRYIAREREVDRMRWKSGVAQKKLERKKKNVFIIVIQHYCWYHNKYASGISTTRKKSRTTKEKLLSNQERKIERIKQLWNRVKQMSRNFSTETAGRAAVVYVCLFEELVGFRVLEQSFIRRKTTNPGEKDRMKNFSCHSSSN